MYRFELFYKTFFIFDSVSVTYLLARLWVIKVQIRLQYFIYYANGVRRTLIISILNTSISGSSADMFLLYGFEMLHYPTTLKWSLHIKRTRDSIQWQHTYMPFEYLHQKCFNTMSHTSLIPEFHKTRNKNISPIFREVSPVLSRASYFESSERKKKGCCLGATTNFRQFEPC